MCVFSCRWFESVCWKAWHLLHLISYWFENLQVIQAFNTGYCQPPPPGCPRGVYTIMVRCWWAYIFIQPHHTLPVFRSKFALPLAGTLTTTLVSASLKWCSHSTMTRGSSWRWTQETRQAHHFPSHLEHHWNTDKNCTKTCRTHTSDNWKWMGRIACMEQNHTQVCADYVITNCCKARFKGITHIIWVFKC